MRTSITSRLILLITLWAGGIIALGLLVDYRLSREEILQGLMEDSQESVTDVVIDLEGFLRGVEGSTRILGGMLAQQTYTPEALTRLLGDVVANDEDIFGATMALDPGLASSPRGFAPYFYKSGDSVLRSDLTRSQPPYTERAWFADPVAAGRPIWTEPYFDAGGGDVYMTTYSVPVYHRDDNNRQRLYGVVTADITLRQLHRYLKRLELGEHGLGILVSRGGLVLSSRDPEGRMVHYTSLVNDPQRVQVWREIIAAATPGAAPAQRMDCDLMAGTCMVRTTRLRHTGWVLGVVYSEREVLAPLRDYEYKTLAIGLLSLLTMALAVSLVTRRTTRHLSALAHTADEFGDGNFEAALPRARGTDEVARLIRSFSRMKDELKRYIVNLEQATASRSRLEGELSAAREIQMSMLPQGGEAVEQGQGFALWAKVRPARTVGGDLFTYSQTDRRLYFAVGDVSDKGVPAALFMARTMSSLRNLDSLPPGRTLAEVNETLVEGNDNCMFVTLLLGVLDLDSLELTFASAGHTPPMLVRDGLVSSLAQASGPATGLAGDQDFPDNRVQLAAGDRLVAYTDGIDEAFDREGNMFGTERLGHYLATHQDDALPLLGRGLLDTIGQFSSGMAQSDDITLLCIELDESPGTRAHQRSFPLVADVATDCNRWLQQVLSQDIDPGLLGELMLVLEEIVTNVYKYAGLDENDAVEVRALVEDSQVVLEVRDRGIPFDPLAESRRAQLGQDTASAEIGGLGVHLIIRLTDWQRYAREGEWNCLEVGCAHRGAAPS